MARLYWSGRGEWRRDGVRRFWRTSRPGAPGGSGARKVPKEAFGVVGFAFFFTAEKVRAPVKRSFVSQPVVAPGGKGSDNLWDVFAQTQGSLLAAVANGVGSDLAGAPTKGDPQASTPACALLCTKLQSSSSSSTSPFWLGSRVSSEAGGCLIFFPHLGHHGLVADTEGARDAAEAHAVLVGGHDLCLERLAVRVLFSSKWKVRPQARHLARCAPLLAWSFLRKRSLPHRRQAWSIVVESITEHRTTRPPNNYRLIITHLINRSRRCAMVSC